MEYKQACKIFGINKITYISDIKKKYKILIKQFHPDNGGTNEEMVELVDAYNTLVESSRDGKVKPPLVATTIRNRIRTYNFNDVAHILNSNPEKLNSSYFNNAEIICEYKIEYEDNSVESNQIKLGVQSNKGLRYSKGNINIRKPYNKLCLMGKEIKTSASEIRLNIPEIGNCVIGVVLWT